MTETSQSTINKADLLVRSGTAKDQDWLFQLYRHTLHSAIDRTWGWDEWFQQQEFENKLPAEQFHICLYQGQRVAAWMVRDKPKFLWLEMLLVEPEWQNQGIGRWIVKQLQSDAHKLQKSIKLSIIKANPVKGFYVKMGFELYHSDEHFYKMVCIPYSNSDQ